MIPFSAYQALVTELAALKRDGFVRPDQLPPAPEAPQLPAVVQQAIAGIADGDPTMTARLVGVAWNLKRQGTDDEVIAQKITDGEPAEL